MDVSKKTGLGRRELLAGLGASTIAACVDSPPVIRSEKDAPGSFHGVFAGDVGEDWAMVWGRSDRPAQMVVEWRAEGLRGELLGPLVGPGSSYTGVTRLVDLPPGAEVDYEVRFVEEHGRAASPPRAGRLRTAPRERRAIEVLWSGDTCGQGFGVGEPEGPHEVGSVGMRTYASMAAHDPDLMIHCGDLIYADNPVPGAVRLPDVY